MPSPHRINVVVPSRAYILKVQREAKKMGISISELFRKGINIIGNMKHYNTEIKKGQYRVTIMRGNSIEQHITSSMPVIVSDRWIELLNEKKQRIPIVNFEINKIIIEFPLKK